MSYFKINYDKLKNLNQTKYHIFIGILISIILLIILISFFININKKITLYGICNDNILTLKINSKLSDNFKNNSHIKFNNKKLKYTILNYGKYEIIDNEIYQEINLTIENKLIDNEVGKVELYYNKEKLIKFIFKLFK